MTDYANPTEDRTTWTPHFRRWYDEADIPDFVRGRWVDLETGFEYVAPDQRTELVGEALWRENCRKRQEAAWNRLSEEASRKLRNLPLPDLAERLSRSRHGQRNAADKARGSPGAEKYLALAARSDLLAGEILEAIAANPNAGPRTALHKNIKAEYARYLLMNAEASRAQNEIPGKHAPVRMPQP